MAGLGALLFLLGAGGMDDLANRPVATAYILIGLALCVIEYFRQKKSHCTNRPK